MLSYCLQLQYTAKRTLFDMKTCENLYIGFRINITIDIISELHVVHGQWVNLINFTGMRFSFCNWHVLHSLQFDTDQA